MKQFGDDYLEFFNFVRIFKIAAISNSLSPKLIGGIENSTNR